MAADNSPPDGANEARPATRTPVWAPPAADHDHGYKLLFGHAEMVRDLLVGFVDEPWVKELRFDTLQRVSASYVSDDLSDREGDLVWRVRFQDRWLYLYLLVEFQSQVDRTMAVRMMGYVSLLYQDLIRQGPQAWQPPGAEEGEPAASIASPQAAAGTAAPGESAPSLASSQRLRLPPVLPIVLYNGRPRWSAATEMADLIEPPPGRLARFTPRMSYLLLDEGAIDETAPLALKNLAAALFHLDKSRTPDTMQAVVGSLMEWLTQPEQDSLRRAFTVYILRVLLPSRAPGVAVPQVANLLELRTMLAETVLDWKKQWLEEGEAKGEARGKAEGKAEGKRDTLTRLLTRRFGPLPEWAAHRLSAGTVEQLDVWSESVLDAATLAEVFGGH
jgi:predicted transposase YdaD